MTSDTPVNVPITAGVCPMCHQPIGSEIPVVRTMEGPPVSREVFDKACQEAIHLESEHPSSGAVRARNLALAYGFPELEFDGDDDSAAATGMAIGFLGGVMVELHATCAENLERMIDRREQA
jgi:hypothetical protein